MTEIQLAAFDLDGTLINDDLHLSDGVRHTVAAAQQRGVRVVIATGRDAHTATHFARELALTLPVICFQGALIWDHQHEQTLHADYLPAEMLPEIEAFAEAEHLPLHFGVGHRAFLTNHYPHAPEFAVLLKRSQVEQVAGVAALPGRPSKFLTSVFSTAEREPLRQRMQARFGQFMTIVPSHPHVVEGTPLNASKGNALAWLAGELGIDRQQVLAVGDNDNDISMLQWAGVGVAMGNGSAAAKAAADWIAPDQSNDGVAAAIQRYILRN